MDSSTTTPLLDSEPTGNFLSQDIENPVLGIAKPSPVQTLYEPVHISQTGPQMLPHQQHNLYPNNIISYPTTGTGYNNQVIIIPQQEKSNDDETTCKLILILAALMAYITFFFWLLHLFHIISEIVGIAGNVFLWVHHIKYAKDKNQEFKKLSKISLILAIVHIFLIGGFLFARVTLYGGGILLLLIIRVFVPLIINTRTNPQ